MEAPTLVFVLSSFVSDLFEAGTRHSCSHGSISIWVLLLGGNSGTGFSSISASPRCWPGIHGCSHTFYQVDAAVWQRRLFLAAAPCHSTHVLNDHKIIDVGKDHPTIVSSPLCHLPQCSGLPGPGNPVSQVWFSLCRNQMLWI